MWMLEIQTTTQYIDHTTRKCFGTRDEANGVRQEFMAEWMEDNGFAREDPPYCPEKGYANAQEEFLGMFLCSDTPEAGWSTTGKLDDGLEDEDDEVLPTFSWSLRKILHATQ